MTPNFRRALVTLSPAAGERPSESTISAVACPSCALRCDGVNEVAKQQSHCLPTLLCLGSLGILQCAMELAQLQSPAVNRDGPTESVVLLTGNECTRGWSKASLFHLHSTKTNTKEESKFPVTLRKHLTDVFAHMMQV